MEEQLVAFKEHFGAVEFARAHALGVTPYELLIVASMVEREAVVPGDRPKIAAVIYNRLKAGMPLGIDASIYYAVELRDGIATYTGELTEADLHTNPPYNTRSAFAQYDDNLEHSQWLGLMYPRLELLRELLTEDGSIWVSLDDSEAHYFKVMGDEIFGRRNFILDISWQKRDGPPNESMSRA